MIYVYLSFITFLLCYILSYLKKIKKLIFLFKILTSLSFILIGLLSLYTNQECANTWIFLLSGLFLGFMGDIFLGIRSYKNNKSLKLFIFGLSFFALGHLSYIMATFQFYHIYSSRELIVSIIITLIILFIIKHIEFNFQKARLISYVYIIISSFLLIISFFSLINNLNEFTKLYFCGIFLFVSSDFLLAYIYFMNLHSKTINWLKIFNILTYFTGQAFIATSIMFL